MATVTLVLALAAGCGDDDNGATATPTPGTADTATPNTPGPAETPALADDDQPDVDRVLEHARVLSVEIGPRVAGSASAWAAIDYIAAEFETYGYDVELHEFEFQDNRYPPGEMELGETTIEALTLFGSASGEASGEIVFAGAGTEDDLEGVEADGAVVVIDRGEVRFGEMYERASARGAVAVVVVNNADLPLAGGQLDTSASIPVIGISLGQREFIEMAADGGIAATVRATGPVYTSVNVVARTPGSDECQVLAGGHHDTVAGAPGANDNASGVAHVLEIARVSAADGPQPGLCFATFGAEESGLHGSAALAADMESDGTLPQYMVNFDVTGLGSPVQAIGHEALIDRSIEAGRELGLSVARSMLPPNLASDHVSFERLGSTVLFFTTGMYDEYHSPEDVFDILERDALDVTGRLGYAVIMDLYAELAAGE